MKAFAINAYKDEVSLMVRQDPIAAYGQVVVQVAAASVNPLDVRIMQGEMKAILRYDFPLVLGHDLAGTVISVGEGVSHFKVGDEVYGCTSNRQMGTFAERVVIDAADLTLKPQSLNMVEAAALPLVALTAWQALVARAGLKRGDKVFIQAGSGGVGTIAIQLAKHLGAHVATTAGPLNLGFAKELGADEVIDYRSQDFETLLSGYDVALNSQSADALTKSLTILRPGGQLISISGPPDPAFGRQIGAGALVRAVLWLASLGIRRKAKAKGVGYSFLYMQPSGAQLTEIARLVDDGTLRPVVDEVFFFDDTPAALAKVETGHARGKVVINVASRAGPAKIQLP